MDFDTLQPISAAERAKRSCFVGNIPYEATEEALKEIFSQAGPVVSFRLVYDRETGKPKGYGFCEYQDIETAQSALRNLNNTDFNGRPLRVGVAAGESNKDDMAGMQQALGGPVMESPYGDPVESEKAPEAISKAVASLPPEQMFELMKQMKLCIQNNPAEARNMLLQNPQLAYALLQAQIVMKIVDPQAAMAMLHRDSSQIPPAASSAPAPQSVPVPPLLQQAPVMAPAPSGPDPSAMGPGPQGPNMGGPGMMGGPPRGPGMMGPPPGVMGGPGPHPGPAFPPQGGPMMGPGQQGPPRPDFRDPRDPRMMPAPVPRPVIPPVSSGPPASMAPSMPGMPQGGMPSLAGLSGLGSHMLAGGSVTAQDQEKAALIMQVLQLTDQQIAMLPPDQRQSILILKEQITKSS